MFVGQIIVTWFDEHCRLCLLEWEIKVWNWSQWRRQRWLTLTTNQLTTGAINMYTLWLIEMTEHWWGCPKCSDIILRHNHYSQSYLMKQLPMNEKKLYHTFIPWRCFTDIWWWLFNQLQRLDGHKCYDFMDLQKWEHLLVTEHLSIQKSIANISHLCGL